MPGKIVRRKTSPSSALKQLCAISEGKQHQEDLPKKVSFEKLTNGLFTAIEQGDVEVVAKLLDAKASPSEARPKRPRSMGTLGAGETPLLAACYHEHIAVMSLLLDCGIDCNSSGNSNDGRSPLMIAAQENYLDGLRFLLQMNAEVNSISEKGETALGVASLMGQMEAIELLLEVKADLEHGSPSAGTPLFSASRRRSTSAVACLVDRKANINARRLRGATPLFAAAEMGNIDVVKLLLEKGANPALCYSTLSGQQYTPQKIAALEGHDHVSKELKRWKWLVKRWVLWCCGSK